MKFWNYRCVSNECNKMLTLDGNDGKWETVGLCNFLMSNYPD